MPPADATGLQCVALNNKIAQDEDETTPKATDPAASFLQWDDLYEQFVEFLRPRLFVECGLIRDDALRKHNESLHQWVHQQCRCKSSLLSYQIERLNALGLGLGEEEDEEEGRQQVDEKNLSSVAVENVDPETNSLFRDEVDEDDLQFMDPSVSLVDSIKVYEGLLLSTAASVCFPHCWRQFICKTAPPPTSASTLPSPWSLDRWKRQNAGTEEDRNHLIDLASLAYYPHTVDLLGSNRTKPQTMHPRVTPTEWLREMPQVVSSSTATTATKTATCSQNKRANVSVGTVTSLQQPLRKRRRTDRCDAKRVNNMYLDSSITTVAGPTIRHGATQQSIMYQLEWQQKFDLLCAYQRENGHCRVPKSWVVNSIKLGRWVDHQRQYCKKNKEGKTESKGRDA